MVAVPFDTLKFVEKLEAGGFTHQQAKAAAEAFADATGQELATKADISAVRTDMQLLDKDQKIWFGRMLIIQLSVIGGLISIATAIIKLL